MSYNADVNLADNTGGTPLHYACRQGNVDIVKLLLTKVNPNLNDLRTCWSYSQATEYQPKDSGKLTPIYQAVFFGHLEIVKLLLPLYRAEKKKDRQSILTDNIGTQSYSKLS